MNQIPNLNDYDALWVMGGPMDVWDVEEHPWLIAEKAAIRTWVGQMQKPFLGLCLGHQLLADALGGTCGPQRPAEIGILEVKLNEEGLRDSLFKGLPAQQKFLQWHSVCVAQAPENSSVLAYSDDCRIQALRVGDNAWSMQYHAEIEADTVENWGDVPAYRDALQASLGENGLKTMKQAAELEMDNFLQTAQQLYENFMLAATNTTK